MKIPLDFDLTPHFQFPLSPWILSSGRVHSSLDVSDHDGDADDDDDFDGEKENDNGDGVVTTLHCTALKSGGLSPGQEGASQL